MVVTTYQTASWAVCVPSTVVRRRGRVQMLTSNAQWPCSQATMALILAVRTLGLPESRVQSRLNVSSLVQRYPGSIALPSPSPSWCAGTSSCGDGEDGKREHQQSLCSTTYHNGSTHLECQKSRGGATRLWLMTAGSEGRPDTTLEAQSNRDVMHSAHAKQQHLSMEQCCATHCQANNVE
jgi:hypothetical protein